MITLESINSRLGFDFLKRWEDYLHSKGECDDLSDSPAKLLTDEESDYLEKLALKDAVA